MGNHYNLTTNKFTCPKRGLYLFALTLTQHFNAVGHIQCAIMLDGNEIGEAFAWSDAESDQSAITTTVVCEANQNVWVRKNAGSGELYGSSDPPDTMFTGVLIQPL